MSRRLGSVSSRSAVVVLLIGPQASGKSTVARALSEEMRRQGELVALVELDQIAAMALPTLPGCNHAARIFGLVAGEWARTELTCVIAEGISSQVEVSNFVAHVPETSALVTVAVTTSFDAALARAQADPTRGVSRDPGFLRARYAEWSREVTRMNADLLLDTSEVAVEQAVWLIADAVGAARPGIS